MAKSTTEENSERKRISIPKADESALAWWDAQKDTGLSVRLLIRNEIERNGYTDTAFRPVEQLPRRGRPPGAFGEVADEPEVTVDPHSADGRSLHAGVEAVGGTMVALANPVGDAPRHLDPLASPVAVQPAPALVDDFSALDALMNG